MEPAEVERWNAHLANPAHRGVTTSPDQGHIGLTVVAALARRHGIRLSLRSGLNRGTIAYVELPARMLRTADERRGRPRVQPLPDAAPPPAPASAARPPSSRALRAAPHPAADHQRPYLPAEGEDDQGSTVLRSSGPATAINPPAPRFASGTTSAQGDPSGWAAPASAAPGGGHPPAPTRQPLPRRIPQQSLPEPLREPASGSSDDSDTDPTPDLITNFKRGTGDADEPCHRL
jgi:hypothetical protein